MPTLSKKSLTLIMTDDAWRRNRKRESAGILEMVFSGNIYRFQSIVECRVLFKNSL